MSKRANIRTINRVMKPHMGNVASFHPNANTFGRISSSLMVFMDVYSKSIHKKTTICNLIFVPERIGMSDKFHELSLWTKHYDFMSVVVSFPTSASLTECWMPLDN